MRRYCTYFDRGYLAQGLALWRSLAHADPAAELWVLALDADAATVMRAQNDPRLHTLELTELLAVDPELAVVRQSRGRSEFIFTLTPCLTRHLLRSLSEGETLAYLDADLFFFGSPDPIWKGLGTGSILVVGHRYPAWHDDSALYGRFNVGVLVFRNDAAGRECLDWWRLRCLESCALTTDGVHYGDQKYLDEWPTRFSGVVELQHAGVNVAPWNWSRHRWDVLGPRITVDGAPLVVFHFAQFRKISARWFDSGQLEYGIMPGRIRSRVYGEYWTALALAAQEVRRQLPDWTFPVRGWSASLGAFHLAALRFAFGQFWYAAGGRWSSGRFGLGQYSGKVMGKYRAWQRRVR
jgi:hypothetical protein